MALQDLATNLSAALSQLYAPKLERQFNRLSVLAGLLGPAKPGRGKNIAWDVMFSGNAAASFVDGADVASYAVDTPVAATLSWGLYQSAFSISGLAQAAAATSMGSADELIALIETSAENAAEKLISVVNADLFAGTGASNTVVGLATAVAATGTYAGIARGTYSEWAGTVLANGGVVRPLTKDLIDQLEAAVYLASGKIPTAIVASAGVCRKYEGLFDSINRVNLVGPGELSAINRQYASGQAVLSDNIGATGLHYKGIPVFRDRNCQSNTLYMINQGSLELQFLPQPAVNTAVMATDRMLEGAVAANQSGVFARLEAMAKTGDADKFNMKVYVGLKAKRPNANGILQDISES